MNWPYTQIVEALNFWFQVKIKLFLVLYKACAPQAFVNETLNNAKARSFSSSANNEVRSLMKFLNKFFGL